MKKKFTLIIFLYAFLMLSTIHAFAQSAQIDWIGWLKTNNSLYASEMTSDQNGNLYIAGVFSDTCDFDPGPGVYQMIEHHSLNGYANEMYVIKVNPQGNLVWGFSFGGDDYDGIGGLLLTNSGKLLVSGNFRDFMDVDPGPNTFVLTSAGSSDGFLCEYDTAGNFIWGKKVGGSGGEYYYDQTSDKDDNIYIGIGYSANFDADPGPGIYNVTMTAASEQGFCKFDSAGNFIWFDRFTSPSQVGVGDFMIDDSGYVYVQGTFQQTVHCPYGITLTAAAGWRDGFTAKYDSAGMFQWAFRIGNTSGTDAVNRIRQDASGNFVFKGIFSGTLDVDPGPGVYNIYSVGAENFYMLVIDGGANFIRVLQFKDDSIGVTQMAFDSTGFLYISGIIEGSADLDPGPDYFYSQSLGDRDFFISKYDQSYNLLWTKTIGSAGDDMLYGFITATGNSLYGIGYVADTTNFEPGSGSHTVVPEDNDFFLAKWNPCFGDSSVIIDTVCSSYISPKGNLYTTSGTYREMFLNADHCDSIVVIHLAVFPPLDTTVSVTACYSYPSPSGTYTWLASGIYHDTIPRLLGGCDSALTIFLTIGHDTTAFHAVTACQRYVSPSGNYIWTTSGIHEDTIPTSMGCDSVITFLLTINSVDTTVSLQPPYLVANAASATYQWMYCDSSILTGEVNQTLQADSNEWFAVIVTQNGCTDTSACYSLSTVSVKNIITPKEFAITPNPSGGIVLIETGEPGFYSVDLYNMMGEKVFSKEACNNKTQMDISHLERGCYIVALSGENFISRKRLVKD